MIYFKFEVAEYNQISTELDIVVYDFQTGSYFEVLSRLLKPSQTFSNFFENAGFRIF